MEVEHEAFEMQDIKGILIMKFDFELVMTWLIQYINVES